MKKPATIVLLCVLVCSFMVGAFVANAQAKTINIPNHCYPSKAPSYCDPDTCKVMDPYICNGKLKYFWTGDYCR